MGSLGIVIAVGSYLCRIPVLRVIALKPKFICLSGLLLGRETLSNSTISW